MTNLGKIVINTRREGYSTDQIDVTMTVGELIGLLSEYDEETPIYFGNDRRSYGWYTYGSISDYDLNYIESDDEEKSEE